MKRQFRLLLIGILLTALSAGPTLAATDILPNAKVQADPESVKSILATFNRAEEALRSKNLPGIMSIYSKSYQNLGLRKEETARIWGDLFARYDYIFSRHLFSKIIVDRDKKTAHVTCTGSLHFRPSAVKPGERPEAVRIDLWFEAVHHLVWEEGTWKIFGHNPGETEDNRFGSAIHLLF